MNHVILDDTLRSKLPDLSKPMELRDETGKIVAHIVPAFNPDDYEPGPEPYLSEEELQRRENSARWYTSAEVLKYLESL